MTNKIRNPKVLLLAIAWLAVVLSGLAPVAAEDSASPAKPPDPADPSIYGIELSHDDLEHWSFRPLATVAPPIPQSDDEWVCNPIDAFVLKKLHAKGLSPAPLAVDRRPDVRGANLAAVPLAGSGQEDRL